MTSGNEAIGWEVKVRFRDWVSNIPMEGRKYLIGIFVRGGLENFSKMGKAQFSFLFFAWHVAAMTRMKANRRGCQGSLQELSKWHSHGVKKQFNWKVNGTVFVGKWTRHMLAVIRMAHQNKMSGGQRPVTVVINKKVRPCTWAQVVAAAEWAQRQRCS